MKSAAVAAAFAAALAMSVQVSAASMTMSLRGGDSPNEVRLGMEYRAKDHFGNTVLTPACSKVECGEYSCPTPFELKMDSTCCGYCWAPDHEVGVDRHRVA